MPEKTYRLSSLDKVKRGRYTLYKVPHMPRPFSIDKPYPSTRANKKLMVLARKGPLVKVVHFGDTRYEDYTTHKDKARRTAYLKRSAGLRDKAGNLTKDDKFSSNYWARKILW